MAMASAGKRRRGPGAPWPCADGAVSQTIHLAKWNNTYTAQAHPTSWVMFRNARNFTSQIHRSYRPNTSKLSTSVLILGNFRMVRFPEKHGVSTFQSSSCDHGVHTWTKSSHRIEKLISFWLVLTQLPVNSRYPRPW